MPRRALAIVDMLSTYDHEDAEVLRETARAAIPAMCGLIERAAAAGVPVIYVNDSFGDWTSDRRAFLGRVLAGEHGAELVAPIVPADDALLVLKARHSIFYETPLGYLLKSEGVEELVLTGQVTEQCILYSALDAHIRHLPTVVARDACAHIHDDLAGAALRMMERNMAARVCDAAAVTFGEQP